MKEKQSVIEGFAPKPIKNSPIPSILIYFEKATKGMAAVAIPQAIFKASLAPKLSAINGITKNPTNDPTNIISCKTDTIVLWSGQIRYVSNSKMIEGACSSIASGLAQLGREHT